MLRIGVCRNPHCTKAASEDPVELYEGPGEYCPECGERLQALPPDDPPRRTWRMLLNRRVWSAAAMVTLAVLALAAARTRAGEGINVCSTTMTDGLVANVMQAYEAQHDHPPAHWNVGPADGRVCDVRFWTAPRGVPQLTIGRDGLVVLVNPRNGVDRLTLDQVRGIFSGRITDWSMVGGSRGAIEAVLPDANSDELAALESTMLRGTRIPAGVQRVASTAEVVRRVAAPGGTRAIGLGAFSGAVPAKVIAVGDAPLPSFVAISDGRYPYAVDVQAESDLRSPSDAAAALLGFVRSTGTQRVVVQSGLVGRAPL